MAKSRVRLGHGVSPLRLVIAAVLGAAGYALDGLPLEPLPGMRLLLGSGLAMCAGVVAGPIGGALAGAAAAFGVAPALGVPAAAAAICAALGLEGAVVGVFAARGRFVLPTLAYWGAAGTAAHAVTLVWPPPVGREAVAAWLWWAPVNALLQAAVLEALWNAGWLPRWSHARGASSHAPLARLAAYGFATFAAGLSLFGGGVDLYRDRAGLVAAAERRLPAAATAAAAEVSRAIADEARALETLAGAVRPTDTSLPPAARDRPAAAGARYVALLEGGRPVATEPAGVTPAAPNVSRMKLLDPRTGVRVAAPGGLGGAGGPGGVADGTRGEPGSHVWLYRPLERNRSLLVAVDLEDRLAAAAAQPAGIALGIVDDAGYPPAGAEPSQAHAAAIGPLGWRVLARVDVAALDASIRPAVARLAGRTFAFALVGAVFGLLWAQPAARGLTGVARTMRSMAWRRQDPGDIGPPHALAPLEVVELAGASTRLADYLQEREDDLERTLARRLRQVQGELSARGSALTVANRRLLAVEEELRACTARLRAVVESAREGIVVFTAADQPRLIYNRALLGLFDLQPDDLRDLAPRALAERIARRAAAPDEWLAAVDRALDGASSPAEATLYVAWPVPRRLLWRNIPVETEHGRLGGLWLFGDSAGGRRQQLAGGA